ncbi:MAG: hypothetical protein GC129_05075 [Proteobacteria bacterium]|nr:hypothetical protein [Pseudomonadota bacterium]
MPRLYKCTRPQGLSVHGFTDAGGLNNWPLPTCRNGVWQPGEWKVARGELKPHFGGLHLAPENMLVLWLREEIYLAETGGEVHSSTDCVVARQGRLLQRLHLPALPCAALALEMAELAYQVFEALIFPWDMLERLRNALALARQNSIPASVSAANAARTWQQLEDVVNLCNLDQFSGFETNFNVMAAQSAAMTILELRNLGHAPTAPANWLVVKNQTAWLMRAMSGLVEDLLLRHGEGFNHQLVPPVAQPFMGQQQGYPLPHHAVRFAVSQHCNTKVLALLEEYAP